MNTIPLLNREHHLFICKGQEEECDCPACNTLREKISSPYPWRRFLAAAKCDCYEKDKPFPTVTFTPEFDNATLDCGLDIQFEIPSAEESLKYFIHKPTGRFMYAKLGFYAPYHILWAVTKGLVCADKNKTVYILCAKHVNEIDGDNIWGLLQPSYNCWLKESSDFSPTFEKLQEACNELHELIIRYCNNDLEKRKRGPTSPGRHFINQLENLPPFVAFQKWRTYEHKKYAWTHLPRKKGGNQGWHKPAPDVFLKVHSVQKMLEHYHS